VTVVTLGETMLRLSPPRGERLSGADRLDLTLGGAESNVAVALAALGVPTIWLGAVPSNELGDRIVAELSGAGVDVSYVVRRNEGRVGLYFVELPVSPRPALVLYDRRHSAATDLTADDLPPAAFTDASHAVVSGITAALKPHGASLAHEFLTQARKRGARRILDVNFRRQLWQPKEAAGTLAELARKADVLICSADDARAVFNVDGDEERLIAALRDLAPNADLVVATLGQRGAAGWERDAGAFRAKSPAVEVIDPLGAGDALVAGLIWAELKGQAPDRRLAAGVALAALACTVRGDHARFNVATLQAVLESVSPKGLR
jgi:2-dehydro-3-deoxygluconokinase